MSAKGIQGHGKTNITASGQQKNPETPTLAAVLFEPQQGRLWHPHVNNPSPVNEAESLRRPWFGLMGVGAGGGRHLVARFGHVGEEHDRSLHDPGLNSRCIILLVFDNVPKGRASLRQLLASDQVGDKSSSSC